MSGRKGTWSSGGDLVTNAQHDVVFVADARDEGVFVSTQPQQVPEG